MFLCNDTATTEIYTLTLHDALPINRKGTVFCSTRNTNADPGVAISDDGGRTWRRVKPPEHAASVDPFIWVEEATGSLFASDIDPSITGTPNSRFRDDGKTGRYSRAGGGHDHPSHFRA